MKRRLRAGREAHRRRPARDRPRAHRRTSRPHYHLQLRPGTNVAVDQRARARRRHRRPRERGLRRASAASPSPYQKWSDFVADAAELARGDGGGHRRAGGAGARRRAALRRRPATARSTTASASPSTARARRWCMGIANLAMATGNLGREGVGREPAARPEQRAGLLRHGLVPARARRLPARVGRRRARAVRARTGACTLERRAGPAHPEHVRGRARRQLQGRSTCRARTSRSPTRTRSTSTAALSRDGMRGRAGPVPERDREVRARVPARARRSSRRTARSPTPSGASRACARSWSRSPGSRTGKSPCASRSALGYPMNYSHPSEIMDEIARLTPTFTRRHATRSSTASAASSGRATTRRPKARRPCTSAVRARQGPVLRHRVRADQRARRRAATR